MTEADSAGSSPRISAEEMEKRRRVVEAAAHSSLMSGAKRDPRTDLIFEAFVRGEIELSDMIPMIKEALGVDQ
jgi:hypothetical protein